MIGCLCSQLQGSNHLLSCLVGLKGLGLDWREVNTLSISLNTYSYVQLCGISPCTHCPVEAAWGDGGNNNDSCSSSNNNNNGNSYHDWVLPLCCILF